MKVNRIELAALMSIVVLFSVQAILVLGQGAPLGHDEAVYSLRSRDLAHGIDPLFYWAAYRAPGLPLALLPIDAIRATEPYLRATVTGFGVLLVVSTWWLGRLLFDRRVGLIAAAGLSISPVIVGASTQVWPDVPGAALGLAVLAFYAWNLSRGNIDRWVVVGVPVLTGLATLTRYGAPVPIAIGLIALTLWKYEVAMRSLRKLVLTATLTGFVTVAILFVPEATAWAQSTGYEPIRSPVSAITDLAARNAFPWTKGFIDSWEFRERLYGGFAVGAILAVGLASGITGTAIRRIPLRSFAVALTTTLATAGAIAYLLHGEPRYMAPAFPWLWITAATGLAFLTRNLPKPATILIGGVALVLGATTAFSHASVQSRYNRANYQDIETAATRIDTTSDDYSCSVLTSYTPQVGWYSKCSAFVFDLNALRTAHPALPSGVRYMMLVERGKRQPGEELLDAYLEQGDLVFTTGDPSLGPRHYIEVYLVEQSGP